MVFYGIIVWDSWLFLSNYLSWVVQFRYYIILMKASIPVLRICVFDPFPPQNSHTIICGEGQFPLWKFKFVHIFCRRQYLPRSGWETINCGVHVTQSTGQSTTVFSGTILILPLTVDTENAIVLLPMQRIWFFGALPIVSTATDGRKFLKKKMQSVAIFRKKPIFVTSRAIS